VAILVTEDIARHPTGTAGTEHTVATTATTRATTPTTAAAVPVSACTPAQGHTRPKAARPLPQLTPTTLRPPQTRSQRRRKSGATRASRCPLRSSRSRHGARTAAWCGTGSGTGAGTTSRWTSTSCTRRRAGRTRASSKTTRLRRRGTWTTTARLSSTILCARSCLRACRGKASRLSCLMTR